MPDVFHDLARSYEQVARSRPTWATTEALTQVARAGPDIVDRLVTVVRDDAPDHERSDMAVRELANVGIDEPDALVVLLHALGAPLLSRMHERVTRDHQADALGDLVFVIFDSLDAGELDSITRIAHRLVNRAHNRAYKRLKRVRPLPFPTCEVLALGDSTTPDVADVASARTDLERFAASVNRAVAIGRISRRGWTAFVDQRLARALTGGKRRASAAERNAASRAARRVRPFVEAHLLSHAH